MRVQVCFCGEPVRPVIVSATSTGRDVWLHDIEGNPFGEADDKHDAEPQPY